MDACAPNAHAWEQIKIIIERKANGKLKQGQKVEECEKLEFICVEKWMREGRAAERAFEHVIQMIQSVPRDSPSRSVQVALQASDKLGYIAKFRRCRHENIIFL